MPSLELPGASIAAFSCVLCASLCQLSSEGHTYSSVDYMMVSGLVVMGLTCVGPQKVLVFLTIQTL